MKLKIWRRIATIVVAGALSAPCFGQTLQPADSISQAPIDECFEARQLIVPASLMVVGAAATAWLPDVRHDIGDALSLNSTFAIDRYTQWLPAVGYLGLGAIGVEAKHKFTDRLIIEATGYAAVTALTLGLKYTINETRPNGKPHSFPSGHTARAFVGAELIRMEYGTWWGVGAYSLAALTGVMRICNHAHWYGDVIFGAGLGILSAKIGWWMLPVWKRMMPRRVQTMTALPFYNPEVKTIGLALSGSF